MYAVPWVVDGVWGQVDDCRSAPRARPRRQAPTLLSEIEDGPDGRLYRVEDPEGHRWMFAQA